MGVPHSLQWQAIQTVFLLGYETGNIGDCDAWHCKEDTEDAAEGNCQGRENKNGIFQRKIQIDDGTGWKV